MDYNVLEIPHDPLSEYLEDPSHQAVAGWLQDLPVFFEIPLVVHTYYKAANFSARFVIYKLSETRLGLRGIVDNETFVVDLSAIHEDGGKIIFETFHGDDAVDRARNLIVVLALFMEYTDRHRMYPFYVIHNDKKKKKGRRKKKHKEKREEKTTIIYLNRPPQGGCHGSNTHQTRKFGYPRRSHRRTLTHPRFKNHPKYKVYKGVRVKQTWCGPKEFQDRRRIYRLIEIQDEEYNS